MDLESWGLLIESELIFLIYFSIVAKSGILADLFIVMVTSLFITQIKSTIIFNLIFFRYLLMLAIYWVAELMINSVFNFAMEIMTYFHDGPLVIMLILCFFCPSLQFFVLIVFSTSLADKNRKASLIYKTSLTFGKILASDAWV